MECKHKPQNEAELFIKYQRFLKNRHFSLYPQKNVKFSYRSPETKTGAFGKLSEVYRLLVIILGH